MSSRAMPPSRTRPIGAGRAASRARSAAHRAFEMITGPTPRSALSPTRRQGSRRKAPSFHSGPSAAMAAGLATPSPGPTSPSLASPSALARSVPAPKLGRSPAFAPGSAPETAAAAAANGLAVAAAAGLATMPNAAAGRGSSGGIEGLFEGMHAQTGVGGQKRLLGARPQLQVGVDHLLDGIDDAVGTKAGPGDVGQGRRLAG